MSTNLKVLIGKLNDPCRKAAERAASICLLRGHYEVDLEHFFLALTEQDGGDLPVLARRYGIDVAALERDLLQELSRFKTGNSRTPVFSPHLPKLFAHAWLIASLESETSRIRSGHCLLALLTTPELQQLASRSSRLFLKFPVDDLKHRLDELTTKSSESTQSLRFADAAPLGAETPADDETILRGGLGRTPALDQFTSNLTARALEGKIDPVIGRETEIRQLIDILMRRRQNNPILTGEAGVGKTAVVEGLALRIAIDDVPQPLRGVAVHVLDLGLLQAGASVKGEFENRLKTVIDEVKKSPHPIILFIDEAHTLIGAGGSAGQGDAANLLKPALARGELRTIAATTWSEYKKYFEKDAALARRFQLVKVEEPSEALAAAMLRGMTPLMERHFKVRILDEAITEAVRLSARYVTGRQLPDKAIGVLDTACARVALGLGSRPALLDDTEKALARVAAERTALQRDAAIGHDAGVRLAELDAEQHQLAQQLEDSTARWMAEKALAEKIMQRRQQLEAAAHMPETTAASSRKRKRDLPRGDTELESLLAELRSLQGEQPLVPLQVDGRVAAEIVAAWTGIPLGKMVVDELKTVLSLKQRLQTRVIGQDHALEAVAQRVRTARANLEDPNKPKGVFLFVGPSGVGKTETALALADVLYGGERNLITINMSEYQEAHSVSGLKGSPPGYVGFGEGGVLTEAVRRKPHSVLLLDEVEKAHPDVLELFFQVFDKGVLDDAEGREIDFRNTLIILTSNVGSAALMQACLNTAEGTLPDAEALTELIRPQLFKAFKPAFLGRMKTVPFYPIADAVLLQIIELKLAGIRLRVAANHKAEFVTSRALVDALLSRCTEVDSGARNVDHILNGTLLPEMATTVLSRMAEGRPITRIRVGATSAGVFTYEMT